MSIRAAIRALIWSPSAPARIAGGLCLAATGFLHAQLYVHGYRAIPWIGPMFLLQGSAALAVGVLLLIAGPVVLQLAAAGLAAGSLAGFGLSRTVGVFGFVERGFDPKPQALLSLLSEVAVLALLAWSPARQLLGARHSGGASGP